MKWIMSMHYRTAAVNFLEPPDEFLAALGREVTRVESTFDGSASGVVLPNVPA